MKDIEYQRFLFDTAMLVMACDGEVHDDEVSEMEQAFKISVMFKGLDFNQEMKRLLDNLHDDTSQTVSNYFETLASVELNPVQKLQVLEIVLRIMYADDRTEENEIRFFRLVKDHLGVMDEIFHKRFGAIDFVSGFLKEDEKDQPSMKHFVAGFDELIVSEMAASKVDT